METTQPPVKSLPKIHPTAKIHHSVIIYDESVEIGEGTEIGPFCYIGPNVKIGKNNRIASHVAIGEPAEHRDYFSKYGQVVIGDNNVIREFVTIQSSTAGITKMGNDCVMLRGSHLSHDSELQDSVNISCNVLIGGHSLIMQGANLGLGCIIHQFQVIGSYAMIGMGAVITKNAEVEPAGVWVGNPAKFLKKNELGLLRKAVSPEDLEVERELFWHRRLE